MHRKSFSRRLRRYYQRVRAACAHPTRVLLHRRLIGNQSETLLDVPMSAEVFSRICDILGEPLALKFSSHFKTVSWIYGLLRSTNK